MNQLWKGIQEQEEQNTILFAAVNAWWRVLEDLRELCFTFLRTGVRVSLLLNSEPILGQLGELVQTSYCRL